MATYTSYSKLKIEKITKKCKTTKPALLQLKQSQEIINKILAKWPARMKYAEIPSLEEPCKYTIEGEMNSLNLKKRTLKIQKKRSLPIVRTPGKTPNLRTEQEMLKTLFAGWTINQKTQWSYKSTATEDPCKYTIEGDIIDDSVDSN